MNAHVIVNPYRAKPNTTLEAELDRQGIDAKIWAAIPDKDSAVRSINLSHKQVVRFAKEHHIPEICIMEEDVLFPAPDGWQYFLENKPQFFDLYLGGAYNLNSQALSRVKQSIDQYGGGPVAINNFAGLHCYIISESYYDKFLEIPVMQHIDNQPGMGRFFVCAPFAALQHPGWSDNAKAMVDYNCDPRILPPECIYYGIRQE